MNIFEFPFLSSTEEEFSLGEIAKIVKQLNSRAKWMCSMVAVSHEQGFLSVLKVSVTGVM